MQVLKVGKQYFFRWCFVKWIGLVNCLFSFILAIKCLIMVESLVFFIIWMQVVFVCLFRQGFFLQVLLVWLQCGLCVRLIIGVSIFFIFWFFSFFVSILVIFVCRDGLKFVVMLMGEGKLVDLLFMQVNNFFLEWVAGMLRWVFLICVCWQMLYFFELVQGEVLLDMKLKEFIFVFFGCIRCMWFCNWVIFLFRVICFMRLLACFVLV